MRMRFLGIIVVVALLVSSAGVRPADAAGTVAFVSVSTVDGYVGEYEEYHVGFVLNRDVKPGEAISIVFDDSVNRAGFTRDCPRGTCQSMGPLQAPPHAGQDTRLRYLSRRRSLEEQLIRLPSCVVR